MLTKNTMLIRNRQTKGFSLVELLVAMVVGLVIISGAFSMHGHSRKAQIKSEEQMDMVADARFAIEMIAYDLRHAGMWGGTNKDGLINCKSLGVGAAGAPCTASTAGEAVPTPIAGDCESHWYYDLSRPVLGVASAATGVYTPCINSRRTGTDMLTVRYADSNRPAGLVAGQAYVRSNIVNGRVFVGATQPELESYDSNPLTANYELRAHLYYVSTYADAVGDGIPSLRRAALVNGPSVEDQLLIPGVHDFQVAFGEDVDGDDVIDRYSSPQDVTDWAKIYSAKIWLVMRTDNKQIGITTTKSFTIDGVATSYGSDGHLYFMVSSVVNMRNLRQL